MFFSAGRGAAHSPNFSMASLISFSMPMSSNSGVSYWLCRKPNTLSVRQVKGQCHMPVSLPLTLLMSCLTAVEISVSFSVIILCRAWSCCSLKSTGRVLPLRKASLARCTACRSIQTPAGQENAGATVYMLQLGVLCWGDQWKWHNLAVTHRLPSWNFKNDRKLLI